MPFGDHLHHKVLVRSVDAVSQLRRIIEHECHVSVDSRSVSLCGGGGGAAAAAAVTVRGVFGSRCVLESVSLWLELFISLESNTGSR